MQNVHAARSAGWSALCFVAVLIVATLLTGALPPITTKPDDLALFVDVHRSALLWSAWLTFPAAAFFLWFAVGLYTYLGIAPGRQEGLPMFAMIAATIIVAEAFIAGSLQTAIAYAPPDVFHSNGLAGVYDAFIFLQGGLGYAPLAIFAFAVAHSMRRHGSAPAWLAWLGYLAALGAAIATLTVFFTDPFLAPNGAGGSIVGGLPSAIWLVATGIILVRAKPIAEPA